MTTVEAPIGARVQVAAGIGHVRWSGSNPAFAAGKWVGVELIEAGGKNDGSVKGERYFDCQPNHGVFVRPSQVKVLDAPAVVPPTPRQTAMGPPPTPSANRLSSAGPSRAASPQRPGFASRQPSAPATPPRAVSQPTAGPTPSRSIPTTPSRRPSTAAPPTPSTRATGPALARRPPSVAAGRSATPSAQAPGLASDLIQHAAKDTPNNATAQARRVASPAAVAESPRVLSPSLASAALPRPAVQRSISSALSPAFDSMQIAPDSSASSRPTTPGRETPGAFANKRELDELRIKVRTLEGRKHEDQDRIKDLESRAAEVDTLRAARIKLQAKFHEIQSSLVAAQRSAKDLQVENNRLETRATEAFDQLEMAALDREVAEEKAEAADAEVVKLSEKLSELELEVAVLKEENAEYDKPAGFEGERNSLAFVQLEKHNERLKEALIRLRDMSSETERDHKAKLAELEKQLNTQEDLLGKLAMAEAKLRNAEAQVEDLKQQLDDALGAEDMLEQLTNRNLQMGERIEEMRATIEDLESLKELSDELEENHVEAEKQLHLEIDGLTVQLRTEQSRSGELDHAILDMESTINQFRDLVADLQSEIDLLRFQQASQESETASTSKEAQALLNLNLKLQSTAVKAQTKTVDLELRKLESTQLAEHLTIITAYLPDAYNETDLDSTTLYLFFNRISAKVEILINVISQIHNIPNALYASTSSEAFVGVCELKGKLRHFAGLNKRFSGVMLRATTEDWIAYGKMLGETGGIEARVDGWLNAVKGDEFSESDCARELGSLINQFDHLADSAFNRPQLDMGEQQLALAHNVDCDLDNFAAAVGFARQAISTLVAEDDIEVQNGDSSLEAGVYEPIQRILDLVRGVKAPSGKLVAQIGEVVESSSALASETTLALDHLATAVSNAVDLAVQLAQRIGAHVSTVRTTKQPLRLADIEAFLFDITAESSAQSDAHPWELIGMFVTRLGQDLGGVLPRVKDAIKNGQMISMDAPPPWLGRVEAIKQAASFNADTERKVVKLSEELKDMLREIKIRDQNLQEAGVKVETLERRVEASRKQSDIIIELENDVAKAKKQEKVYEDAIEQLQAEQDALEAENVRLRKSQAGGDRQGNTANLTPGGSVFDVASSQASTAVGVESSHLAEQVQTLRSVVRYLRQENALLKSKELYNDIHSLPVLRHGSMHERGVPDLIPPSPSSGTESDSDGPHTPSSSPVRLTQHSLETESKLLFRQLVDLQTSPKIVDISQLGHGEGWRRRKDEPEMKVNEWRRKERKLEKRLEGLMERARGARGR
ncbi:hypothetical protein IAU60_003324 [Kwoniella sp. DSM 27419]